MLRISLTQLHYLVAIADHGGITAAARAVHISQSAISSALAKLEESLGQRLFERAAADGARLTSFGAEVLDRARGILEQVESLQTLGQARPSQLDGVCRLGCYWYLAPICLAPLSRQWEQLHPGCQLLPFFSGFGEVNEALLSGRVDLALTYNIALGDAEMICPVMALQARALLPSTHRLAASRTVSLAELAGEPLVVVDEPAGKEQLLSLFTVAGLTPRKVIQANSFEMMCSLIGNGVGVGVAYLLPAVTTSYDGRRLICRPISDPCEPLTIAIYGRRGEALTPQAEALARLAGGFLAERLMGVLS
jgi:DNA-binding transcriptional LysR family regulator